MVISPLPLLPLLLLPCSLAELLFVAAIWRHGDRAPGDLPYPLDRNNESAWPRGWNQLTNEGIQETNRLGTWLRNRYVVNQTHIGSVFNKDQVLFQSSDSERALASAQSVAAALFPASGQFVWQAGNTWQPTPIHSMGEGREDPLLKPTSIDCPAYESLMEQERQPLFNTLNDSNTDLFRQLSNYTGMNITSANVDDLYDITREIAHNMTQPAWVTSTLMAQISEFKRQIRLNEFDTAAKARYMGGYLLGDWSARINAASAGAKKAMKTVLYSSHDGTLSALLATLGVSNDLLVPYAAAVVAELHRVNGSDFVQIHYHNDTLVSSTPHLLTIPNCTASCPLADFNKIYSSVVINTTQELKQLCSSSSLLVSSLLPFLFYFLFSR